MARTTKTSQVMNLVKTGRETASPAAKSERPKNAQNIVRTAAMPQAHHNPALRILSAEPKKNSSWSFDGKQIINIISVLLNEEMYDVIQRFHCCDCDVCLKALTESVISELPPVFVHVKGKADEEQVNSMLKHYRPTVIKVLTRKIIALKSASPHNKKFSTV